MHRLSLSLLLLLVGGLATAQTETPDQAAVGGETTAVQLETILVTGEQPGPGLWKVSKGDHVLWILGTVSPLPKKMVWLAPATEAVIAESSEIIAPPQATVGIGWFKAMTMLPTLLGARKNPDGIKLKDVVPPALYARWQVQKRRYLGKDKDSEGWRPIFAGSELYARAIDKSGLADRGVVWPVVRKLAKKHRIPVTQPRLKLDIQHARKTVKTFRKSELDDLACFDRLLDRVEHQLPALAERANAWAVGDLAALRQQDYSDLKNPCWTAIMQSSFVADQKLGDLEQRLDQLWFDAAEKALAQHRQSFAQLSIYTLLEADGYLARLVAKGYQIEAPDGLVPVSTESDAAADAGDDPSAAAELR